MSDETFRTIVTGGVVIAALSFLVMGVVAAILAWLGLKIKAKLDPILEKVNPIVGTFKETVGELKPKISTISTQAVEVSKLVTTEAHRYSAVSKEFAVKATDISDLVKTEAHRYAGISKDVAERAQVHVAQADQALDEYVDQVQSAAGSAKKAVLRPFREIDGVLTGIGAAVSTLARGRKSSVSHATQDEEMFI